jgi:hypothetical protein
MPLTPDEQAALDERFQALEDRNAKLERLIRSGKAFTSNPLALATDLDDLGSVKTYLDFEEPALTPIIPPADVVRLYAVDDSGATRLISRNASGEGVPREVWLPPDVFASGTGSPTLETRASWATRYRSWTIIGTGSTIQGIQAQRALPADWVSGTVAVSIFYQGQGGDLDDRRIGYSASAITPSTDAMSLAIAASDDDTVAHSNGICTLHTFSSELTVAAGDILRVSFSRNPGHGTDLNTQDMSFLGMVLTYSAFL